MTTITLGDILDHVGVGTLGVLDAQVEVPVIAGQPQAQGDISWWYRPNLKPATTPIPQDGVMVVRAESSGDNTHILHNWTGVAYFDPAGPGDDPIVLGTLTVPAGVEVYAVHTEEHGANGIGPGTYVLHRQREQSDEIRMVAD